MYRVILYFGFGACYASEGEGSSKKILEFSTLKAAEDYGHSKRWTFEPVKVKQESEV